MDDRDDAVPLDYADFDQSAGFVGADEHRHRIVLHEVPDGVTERVEHRRFRDSMSIGALENDRARLHDHKITCQGRVCRRTSPSTLDKGYEFFDGLGVKKPPLTPEEKAAIARLSAILDKALGGNTAADDG